MNRPKLLALIAAAGGLTTLALGARTPAPGGGGATFEVTITNLTRSQPISPVLAATHSTDAAFFFAGEPASEGLALLAEQGDNSVLMGALASNAAVADVVSGMAPIGPGASETLVVQASGDAQFLSLAGMLVNTNDTFVAVDTLRLPLGRSASTLAVAYDAGSEANSEQCAFVPGPACMGSMHDPAPAEGFVYVSNGVHGIGDLAPEVYDWHNPVAEVTVRRVPR